MLHRLLAAGCLAACADPGDDPDLRDFDPAAYDPAFTVERDDGPETWHAVWSDGRGRVWIAGGVEGRARALAGDVDDLAPVELPEGAGTLRAVHGTGPRDVWLGGEGGTLLHWRGRAARSVDAGTTAPILGIAAADPDRVLIVGGTPGRPLARLWDGDAWRPIGLPALPDGTSLAAARVDGDGWLVLATGGVSLRLDGDGGRALPAVGDPLRAVSGPVAVGGRDFGRLWLLAGGRWEPAADVHSVLRGVASVGGGRFVVVGDRGTTAVFDRADGRLSELDPFTLATLRGVAVTPAGATWAVGDGVVGFAPPP